VEESDRGSIAAVFPTDTELQLRIDKKSADRLLARIVAQALELLRRRGIISA